MDSITKMDLEINLFIQENLRTDGLSSFMKAFTVLNNSGLLVIGIVVLLLLIRKYRYLGMAMGLSLSIEFILNNIWLKRMVARPRPYEISAEVDLLVKKALDYSFPSGHTGSAFAISVVLFCLLPIKSKKYGYLAIFLSSLMGYSRLYVGIHYPTDVLGGAALGFITALISIWILNKLEFFKKLQREQ